MHLRLASSPRLLGLSALACAAALLTSAEAAACGGLFCDGGSMPTPVDQTGENILFVVDREAGSVEAHIQIQYTGEPDEFAWVIPVTAIPDFSVGSEQLFTNLLAGTVPTYSQSFQSDCEESDRDLGCSGVSRFAQEDAGGSATAGGSGFDTDGESGGPQIVKREIVGAFEIVVLQGGTAQELYDWLDQNGYAQDDEAPPILAEYLAEGHMFAAAKLLHGAGIDQLQPLVLKYAGDTPCVPLRLTRIAAADDMPIRVFTLGDARSAPIVYKHVEINEARLDWSASAINYMEVVAQAIDTAEGGRAFVTEYAGPSAAVTDAGLYSAKWDASIFVDAQPLTGDYSIVDALTSQGLMECFEFDGGGCSYTHPLLLPILRTYLPTPAGIAEDDFYACMSCFEGLIDPVAWDGAKFAAALEERVIAPGRHARDLLLQWPTLTRMLTILSPHEMTADPEFVENPDLPEVPAARIVTVNVPCEGSNKAELAEGHLLTNADGTWPSFDDSMPWAREVQVITAAGPPQVEEDLSAAITAAIKASNQRFDYDDGSGLQCAVRSLGRSLTGALSLGLVLGLAWRGRRRRRVENVPG